MLGAGDCTSPARNTTTFTASPYTFTIGAADTPLDPNASHSYTVKVVFTYAGAPAANVCNNTPGHGLFNAVALPAGQEPTVNQGNNTACMPPPPSFAVSKATAGGEPGGTGAPVQVNADGTVSVAYTVTVTNTGNVAGKHPAITDTVTAPAGFTVTSVALDGKALTLTNGAYTIPVGTADLAPGATTSYTVTVTLKTGDVLTVDWTKAGTCTTTGAGTPTDGGAFNVVAMFHDTDGADKNDACVPLTPPTGTFHVRKQALNCDTDQPTCSLSGALFELYDDDPLGPNATLVADGLVVDGADGSLFNSSELPLGHYWLVESRAPAGFNLLPTAIQFTLTSTGIVLADTSSSIVTVSATDPFTIAVSDTTPAPLPQAGGPGPWPYALFGLFLLGAAGLYHRKFSGFGRPGRAFR